MLRVMVTRSVTRSSTGDHLAGLVEPSGIMRSSFQTIFIGRDDSWRQQFAYPRQ